VYYKGKETHYASVRVSEKEGLAIIHQELALSPYLLPFTRTSSWGNMKTTVGVINWDKYIVESKKYLDQVGLRENPATIVSKLGVGKQQLVEIARAVEEGRAPDPRRADLVVERRREREAPQSHH
jgi:putative multiple sugar transport system ATP-binding protein